MKKYRAASLLITVFIYPLLCGATSAQTTQAATQAATTQTTPPPPYVIGGHVSDAEGESVQGVRVCAHPSAPSPGVICGISNAQGNFVIRSLEAGKYQLITDKSTDGYMPQHIPFYKQPASEMPEVVLDEQNKAPSVSIVLGPRNGILTGSIVDASNGLPVENASVLLCHTDDALICSGMSAKNTQGKFRIAAPHVMFTLKISADGFEDWHGVGGSDKNDALSVASGSTLDVAAYLKRRPDAAGKAISEAEKQAGVNLPAPLQISPAPDARLDHYPRTTKLEWSRVEGAATYALEVDYCQGGERSRNACVNPQPHGLRGSGPMSDLIETSYEFNFVGAQPGRWRVWAVDKDGREGFKSPWRIFVYLR